MVWDPHHITYIDILEKIQQRAASLRWMTRCYNRYSSVSVILSSLNWLSIAQHYEVSRLSLFHKIMHDTSVLSLPSYYQATQRFICNHHPLHLMQPSTNKTACQYSYHPTTIYIYKIGISCQHLLLKSTIMRHFKLN